MEPTIWSSLIVLSLVFVMMLGILGFLIWILPVGAKREEVVFHLLILSFLVVTAPISETTSFPPGATFTWLGGGFAVLGLLRLLSWRHAQNNPEPQEVG